MFAIIMGSALMNKFSMEEKTVSTEHGDVTLGVKGNTYFLQRHADGLPPHKINHRANIKALQKEGVDKIISINSCGSLNLEHSPGTIFVTSDFIDLNNNQTFYEDKMQFTMPGLDENLRQTLLALAAQEGINVVDGGVYWQSPGPRFETKAEVQMISYFADVVGMTMAKEATLANELSIPYANISAVDNFANGLSEISLEQVEKQQEYSADKILPKLIEAIQGELE